MISKDMEGFLVLKSGFKTEIHNALYMGSAVFLVVTPNPIFLEKILKDSYSKQERARQQAAIMLKNYKREVVVKRLKELLKDDARKPNCEGESCFFIRAAAQHSLAYIRNN